MSHRVERIVFRAHGFIHLNGEGEPWIADSGRETDHRSVPKLRAVDLDLQTVKPNSPHFPGTSLQRDRWDSCTENCVSVFRSARLFSAPNPFLSRTCCGRHVISRNNYRA